MIKSNNIGVTAFVDLEPFKAHTYPDVLLSILLQTLDEFRKAIREKHRLYFMLMRLLRYRNAAGKPTDTSLAALESRLAALCKEIEATLLAQDYADISSTEKLRREESTSSDYGVGIEVEGTGTAAASFSRTSHNLQGTEAVKERTEKGRRDKIGFLLQHTVIFRELLSSITRSLDLDLFIFFDDLYHLPRRDQVAVLDYFHRIAKGTRTWIKIGTIRHRSSWYLYGDPPLGMKIGDDCGEINLDIPLENYQDVRKFLLAVLGGFLESAQISSYRSILSEESLDRLVVASGGVVRDFLLILGSSVSFAQADPGFPGLLQVDHVTKGAFALEGNRREELERDTLRDRRWITEALEHVKNFCLASQCDWFVVSVENDDVQEEIGELVNQLIDLRFFHIVRGRFRLPGDLTTIYMLLILDLSQCGGPEWQRGGFKLIDVSRPHFVDRLLKIPKWEPPDLLVRHTLVG